MYFENLKMWNITKKRSLIPLLDLDVIKNFFQKEDGLRAFFVRIKSTGPLQVHALFRPQRMTAAKDVKSSSPDWNWTLVI